MEELPLISASTRVAKLISAPPDSFCSPIRANRPEEHKLYRDHFPSTVVPHGHSYIQSVRRNTAQSSAPWHGFQPTGPKPSGQCVPHR